MLGGSEKNRFFNAIAFTDCILLTLSKADFDFINSSSERKIFNDKMAFIKTMPEFKTLSLPRAKLNLLSLNLHPMRCIKKQEIFKEGDL